VNAAQPPATDTARRLRLALIAVAAVLGLLGAAVAVRSGARLYHRLSGPPPAAREADPSRIAGWMTVPYVARAYGVSGQDLFGALGLSPDGNRSRSLHAIADASGRDRDAFVSSVREAVLGLRREPGASDARLPEARAPPPERAGR
jgi:hypothetical protein